MKKKLSIESAYEIAYHLELTGFLFNELRSTLDGISGDWHLKEPIDRLVKDSAKLRRDLEKEFDL